jgi:hypothetical protein
MSGLFVAMGRAVVAAACRPCTCWPPGALARACQRLPLLLTALGVVFGFPLSPRWPCAM